MLPVVWRYASRLDATRGVNGVLEVHASDMPSSQFHGARVRDVEAALTRQLAAIARRDLYTPEV